MHTDSNIPTDAKNRIELVGDGTARVYLTQGKMAIIDVESIPIIAPYRWCTLRGSSGNFYAMTSGTQLMHRVLMGAEKGELVDHEDHDGLNNRLGNLRRATKAQNAMNSRPLRANNTSGYKGVARYRKKWQAGINLNGKRIHIGNFDTPEEAARAYDRAAIELFGEFACLNFPDDAAA